MTCFNGSVLKITSKHNVINIKKKRYQITVQNHQITKDDNKTGRQRNYTSARNHEEVAIAAP